MVQAATEALGGKWKLVILRPAATKPSGRSSTAAVARRINSG